MDNSRKNLMNYFTIDLTVSIPEEVLSEPIPSGSDPIMSVMAIGEIMDDRERFNKSLAIMRDNCAIPTGGVNYHMCIDDEFNIDKLLVVDIKTTNSETGKTAECVARTSANFIYDTEDLVNNSIFKNIETETVVSKGSIYKDDEFDRNLVMLSNTDYTFEDVVTKSLVFFNVDGTGEDDITIIGAVEMKFPIITTITYEDGNNSLHLESTFLI
jgi:hypothetical protein